MRIIKNLAALAVASLTAGALLAATMIAPAMWAGQRVLDAAGWWDAIEIDETVFDTALPQRTYLTHADHTPMATLFDQNRLPLASLDDVPQHLIEAVLSIEDRRFYDRGPIDFASTARALATNTVTGTQHGASTISQQYAKLLRAAAGQTPDEISAATDATIGRKIVELKYAIELEARQSKDDILLGYLNIAYFGSGNYGIGAAARHYFDAAPADLSTDQSAMLAGLLRNPVGDDPATNPGRAADRRDTVLHAMADAGYLTATEETDLRSEPTSVGAHAVPNGCTSAQFPFYCDWVVSELLEDPAFGADEHQRAENLRRGGFTVTTAADPDQMAALQQRLDAEIPAQPVAAAVATVTPGTGHVPAIAHTVDYLDSQFNIPVQGQLQVGSVFKPVTYAAGLSTGQLTANSQLTSPTGYQPATGSAPPGGFVNYDHTSYGPTDPSFALGRSLNTWFVRATEQIGTGQVADTAHAMGMRSLHPDVRNVGSGDYSLTLGAFETTVLDTANTYATLAAGGIACTPTPITAVQHTATGEELPAPDPGCQQVLHPDVAHTVTADLAATTDAGGTAEGIEVPGQHWRGKTGTSNSASTGAGATWFAGYTTDLAAAVWLGDPRGPSHPVRNVQAFGQLHTHVYGSTIAAPLWAMAMSDLTDGQASSRFPAPGPVTTFATAIPVLTGLTESAARALAEPLDSQLAVTIVPADDVPAGTVIQQHPKPGEPATAETIEVQVAQPAGETGD